MLMRFSQELTEGRLVRRYKRFLADVELLNGEVITAHTANTGAMTGCSEPGSQVWLSRAQNPKRKYPFTWELVEVAPGVMCGINTMLSNKLVAEAVEIGLIAELRGYEKLRTEVAYGLEKSRIDLLLEPCSGDSRPPCYVEVKNVTLVEQGVAYFPDAVSARGSKHLRELMTMVEEGKRAVIFFCVQRGDCEEVRPADQVDREYGETLRAALACGVEALAYRARVTPAAIDLVQRLPVVCD